MNDSIPVIKSKTRRLYISIKQINVRPFGSSSFLGNEKDKEVHHDGGHPQRQQLFCSDNYLPWQRQRTPIGQEQGPCLAHRAIRGGTQ